MKKLINWLGDYRYIASAFATYAAVYGVVMVRDLDTFYSGYFAGAASVVAMMLWLED